MDEPADLLRCTKDDRGAVTHHASPQDRRRSLLGTVVAGISLEAQISFPELARLAIQRCYPVGVVAQLDCLDPLVRVERLEIRRGEHPPLPVAPLAEVLRARGERGGVPDQALAFQGERAGSLAENLAC